jgi:hypothetical protein
MRFISIRREENWGPKCPRCSWPYHNLGDLEPECHGTNPNPNPNRKTVPVVLNPSVAQEAVIFSQDSILAMKMAEFGDDVGMMASPE